MSQISLSPAQVRAALSLLDWSNQKLAEVSGLYVDTIAKLCRGESKSHNKTVELIKTILEREGIEFLDKDGVRRRSQNVEIFEGPERFEGFYDLLYETVKAKGGDICLSVTDENLLSKYRKDPIVHYKRMQDLHDRGVIKSFRILANKSDFSPSFPYNLYKWQPSSSVAPTAFYVFGDCLALMSFVHDNPPYVVVLQSAPLAASYREAFDVAWQAGKELDPSQTGKA